MNTVQLECFLAVADSLSFARAAEKLHITQPAVTHQINSLEAELNIRLFNRTTRTVDLTSAGWNFIGDARNILNLMTSARVRLTIHSESDSFPFAVGCPSPQELMMLPSIIHTLHNEFPAMHPIIKSAPLPVLQNHLEDHTIDVLLCYKEKDSRRKLGAYTELTRTPAVCVVSPDHSLASRTHVTADDLKEGPAIVCDLRQNPRAVTDLQSTIPGTRPSSEVYFCERLENALVLLKAGIGFTLLPDILPLRDPELTYLPLKGGAVSSYGIYSQYVKNKAVTKRFIELMKNYFNRGL